MATSRPRLLIEEWLPIAEIGIEGLRERTPMTPFPAPNRLHVWWARRPLVASRAAVLASLLPADADHAKFLHMLGIHGDPVKAKIRIGEATRDGVRLGKTAYGYSRAFGYSPNEEELQWLREEHKRLGYAWPPTVLDPTAGGGSIPFEGMRLHADIIANDLNPVAWLILKATIDFPARLGLPVLTRFYEFGRTFAKDMQSELGEYYPAEPVANSVPDGYLWARTMSCPYCGGLVPLSPNWRLDSTGKGVRLVPNTDERRCRFEIVDNAKDHSPATVKGGDGLCPYPDCGRVIDGDEIKSQAQASMLGQQLYAVVYRQSVKVGTTKAKPPKDKIKSVRGFRAPRPEDDVSSQVSSAIAAKIPEWEARNIIPNEDVPPGYETTIRWPLDRYGVRYWKDMFSPRQLLGHCIGVERFQDLVGQIRNQSGGRICEVDQAALVYLAFAMDKLLNYNCNSVRWIAQREVVAGKWDRHDFSVKWSFAELAPTVPGIGYDWAIEQTGKALAELVEMAGNRGGDSSLYGTTSEAGRISITLGSGDSLEVPADSLDCVVVDPPYYNNVTYSELSDFFYVWLKRTAGVLFPKEFREHLTDKDREAVANPFRFRGQKQALQLATRDYQHRMAEIFRECRRVIKPAGVLVVMFTHKASGAWDALATGLVEAGFVITASWPINTESEGSLHIKEKSAAKSTIFLVCRPREKPGGDADVVYWEEIEPKVMAAVRKRVKEFQEAGIGGVDLYLACFGPALQVFSESWPLRRGRPIQKPRELKLFADEEWDPYAVRPEDALDAARREVKRWRMEQLATVKRQHHLDPVTEWYVLAWDAFKAPRFPTDEALKLARVVGVDFDAQVKNVVCELKSSDVVLWDSKARKTKGKLGPIGETCMLDTLHQAAYVVREQNTGVAQRAIVDSGLLDDATLLTALEALLNVLPAIANPEKARKVDPNIVGASSDFDALEKLRRLAFSDQVPEPVQKWLFDDLANDDEESSDAEE